MQWWVVNQPTTFGGRGAQQTNYVVVQSATRPVNAVAGPFATQQDAINFQTSANTAGNSPGSAVGGATNLAVNSLNPLAGLFQASIWIRVAEVAIGVVLLAIGVNALFKGKPLTLVTSAAGGVGKVVP